MICRLRNFLILPVALVVSASLAMAQSGKITRIEENDPSIAYSGNWYTNGSEGHSGSNAALTNTTGARAVVTFTGTGIRWLGVKDRWNGLATVTIDGNPTKVDGWAETTIYQAVLYQITGLSIGPHKLSIEINHERGPNGEGSCLRSGAKLGFNAESGEELPGLLLVDDEANILNALKRLLRREGYRILTASSGAQGLELLAANRVQVILSDQRMPEMSGSEFLSRVKELYPDTVRMVLSGYAELAAVTDAVNRGAIYKYLSKPWDEEVLKAELRQAFRHQRETSA